MSVSENILRLRKERNLTREELSNLSGVSASAIKQYEGGKRTPKLEQLSLLAKTFDVSVEYLLADVIEIQARIEESLNLSNKIDAQTFSREFEALAPEQRQKLVMALSHVLREINTNGEPEMVDRLSKIIFAYSRMINLAKNEPSAENRARLLDNYSKIFAAVEDHRRELEDTRSKD